ncbi:MAG: glucosamine-6-phosphate deaminase [Verrucomicrobiales bacterium]
MTTAAPSTSEQFEKVRTVIHPTAAEAAAALAREVADLITARHREGRATVLGLATGSTPVPFYRELIRLHREEGLSFARVITFNLDEYHGLARDHRESYFRFMREQLFDHVDLRQENIHLPDGTVPLDRAFSHCQAYESAIEEAGGIDLQILGIGRTGHIGFNEPGSTRDSRTRLIALDRITRHDAAADFLGEANVPRFAITMGVGTILRARRIALMAWGENKADIVREAVEGPETEAVSASFLQSHSDARFLVDAAAAKSLTRIKLPWLVSSVEWDETRTRRAVIWLALKHSKPVLKLLDEEYNENGMAELLTRHGRAYDLNIQIFNRLQNTITGWPGGKPGADDTTRPERAAPHPKRSLILAPEPQDDVLSMGATLQRLVEHGHNVRVVYLTSGDLRVGDAEASKFAKVLLETSELFATGSTASEGGTGGDWSSQVAYARTILAQLQAKGPFGDPPAALRRLKGLIRRGEARDALHALGLPPDQARFLDLPFYQKGRYRQFRLEEADITTLRDALEDHQPHQIFMTGHLADPNSVQGVAWRAFAAAWDQCGESAWKRDCRVWLHRGHQKELEPHGIAMAVPVSPDQLAQKLAAIQKFQSHTNPDQLTGDRNRHTARAYDALGLAEYEAIEAFERWA